MATEQSKSTKYINTFLGLPLTQALHFNIKGWMVHGKITKYMSESAVDGKPTTTANHLMIHKGSVCNSTHNFHASRVS